MKARIVKIFAIFLGLILFLVSTSVYAQKSKEDSLIQLLDNSTGKQNMEALVGLIKYYQKSSPEKSLEYGERFNILLENNNDYKLKSEAWFELAHAHIYLRDFEKAIALLEDLVRLRKNHDDEMGYVGALSQLAYVYYRKGSMDSAYKYIVQAQGISEAMGNDKQKAVDMYRRGVFSKKKGKYKEAILYYNKAIEVYRSLDDEKTVGALLGNIGNVFLVLKQIGKALKYQLMALEIRRETRDSIAIAGVLNDIGYSYYKLLEDDKALDYFFEALELNIKIGNEIYQAYNLTNIGMVYSEKGEYAKAVEYLQKSILLKEKIKDARSLVTSYSLLGYLYFDQKKYGKALAELQKSVDLAEKHGVQLSAPNTYRKLALTYSLIGNYTEAYRYQVIYSDQKDTIFDKEKITAINEIQEKYESVEREKEIQQLKFDKEIQGKRQVMLVILVLSVLVFAAMIAINFMIKRQKDKQILAQQDIVHKKENDLARLELEKRKLKEHELQKESDFKSRQLTTHALNMMQKNKLLQELQTDINGLGKKSPSELKPDFRRINLQINRNLKSDNEWDVFKMYFEQVNKNFYSSLMALSPELTNYDLRLCALIKLNLNIKETASVLNVAPNSIKSARYRLRKKLNMEQEDDLYEFVRKVV